MKRIVKTIHLIRDKFFLPRNKVTFFRMILPLLFCLPVLQVWGQTTIAAWNPSGLTNSGPSPFASTTTDPNVTTGGLTRSAGIGIPTGIASTWAGAGFSTSDAATGVATNKYVTFSVTANSGDALSLSSFNLIYHRSSTGPTQGDLQYSLDGVTFISISTLSFSSSAGQVVVPPVNLSTISALQNIASGTTVTFRIVPYAATSTIGSWYIAGSGMSITGTVDTPMPVSLVGATIGWENNPVIKWNVVNQKNNKKFILERSSDNQKYTEVGEVSGGNTVEALKQYTYTDYALEPGQNFYYYKLWQEDEDGTKTLLCILTASKELSSEVFVDNSIPEEIVMHFSGNELGFEVYSFSGQVIVGNTKIATGQTISRLPLAAGLYFICFQTNTELVLKKVLVKSNE